MRSHTISTEVTLVAETCINCGTAFAMEESLMRGLRKNHNSFYCPNGHCMIYNGENEEARLKRELKIKDDELLKTARRLEWEEANGVRLHENLKHTERRLSAAKGVLTRTKNRIANGVCPCCNRYFADLHKHMAGQHPDFNAPDTETSALPALLGEEGAPLLPTGADVARSQAEKDAEQPERLTFSRRGRPLGSRNRQKT